MKKIITLSSIICLSLIVFNVNSYDDEGPSGHTNAPGEQNCNRCHIGSSLNAGSG
jgi:hypothetical protein